MIAQIHVLQSELPKKKRAGFIYIQNIYIGHKYRCFTPALCNTKSLDTDLFYISLSILLNFNSFYIAYQKNIVLGEIN